MKKTTCFIFISVFLTGFLYAANTLSVQDIYGKWVPGKLLITSNVSAMSPERYKKYMKEYKTFFYSNNKVKIGGKVVEHPIFKIKTFTASEVRSYFRLYLDELGINKETVDVIEVYKPNGDFMSQPGSCLFLKNKNTIISICEGGFFELHKQ